MIRVALAAMALVLPAGSVPAATVTPELRLYTLDCGRIDFTDMANFSDTGDHDGEHGAMPVTCFLIKHGADWMLWDAGLGDEIAATAAGRVVVGLHFRVPRTLISQLAALQLTPEDIMLRTTEASAYTGNAAPPAATGISCRPPADGSKCRRAPE